MKKTFFLLASIAALAGCSNGDTSGTGNGPNRTDEDTAAANVHSVINANGNIPDTSNSINIGTETKGTTPTDSTKR